jgi:hypothetical protein
MDKDAAAARLFAAEGAAVVPPVDDQAAATSSRRRADNTLGDRVAPWGTLSQCLLERSWSDVCWSETGAAMVRVLR